MRDKTQLESHHGAAGHTLGQETEGQVATPRRTETPEPASLELSEKATYLKTTDCNENAPPPALSTADLRTGLHWIPQTPAVPLEPWPVPQVTVNGLGYRVAAAANLPGDKAP